MKLLKQILRTKLFWIGILTLFFINFIVNANKEANTDLLNQYYSTAAVPSDTTKNIAEISLGNIRKAEVKPTKADSITAYAKTLLGKGYVYGKVGPDNFDCSGYILHVFKQFNVSLPHSSRMQSRLGEPLHPDSIRKGDLLFFKSPSPNNPNVGHVGIALENENGDVKFIHSSTNRGVVIDSLGSRHYGRRFMEARRILPE